MSNVNKLASSLERLIELKIETKRFVDALDGINEIYADDIVTDEESERLRELHVILRDAKSKLDKFIEQADSKKSS